MSSATTTENEDGERKRCCCCGGGGASPPPHCLGGGGRQKGAPSAGPLYKSSVCNPNPHLLVCLQRVAQGLGVLGIGFCVDLTFVLIPVHPRRCSVLGLKWLRNAPDGQSQRAPPPFPLERGAVREGASLAACPKSPCQRGGVGKGAPCPPPPPPP